MSPKILLWALDRSFKMNVAASEGFFSGKFQRADLNSILPFLRRVVAGEIELSPQYAAMLSVADCVRAIDMIVALQPVKAGINKWWDRCNFRNPTAQLRSKATFKVYATADDYENQAGFREPLRMFNVAKARLLEDPARSSFLNGLAWQTEITLHKICHAFPSFVYSMDKDYKGVVTRRD